MDIIGWLTVITIFTAIFTLIPREDLKLTLQNINRWEKNIMIFFLFILIPFLIIFPKLVYRFPFFNYFCFTNGFDPSNIAFGLFYVSFIWFILRFSRFKPKFKDEEKPIDYYFELLNEKSFDDFFKLFTKYTSPDKINDEWDSYRNIIFNPKFLNGVLIKQPTYLLQFWDKFSSEAEFQAVFRLFLENENSAYYKEIKEHWNSYSLLVDDKPFLNKVLNENIQQSIGNGILMLFSDFVARHLRGEHDKISIYNQQHYDPRIREEEGFDLPVYYHIRFIGLMYSSAIDNKIDISKLSKGYTNMQSIYSCMIAEMINNIIIIEGNEDKEYPTNYHWLISEIFSLNSNWLDSFIEEIKKDVNNSLSNSSYIVFIPFCFSLCIDELYKGFTRKKISQNFIDRMMYYNVLTDYFGYEINEVMKSSIEDKIINEIPQEHLEPILGFALNERFAISFNSFKQENFGHSNSADEVRLKRLFDLVKSKIN